jgi:DNA-binding NtrC family response regulator/CHASE2 domain-containing sensor protein
MHRHNTLPILKTLVRSTAGIACLIAIASLLAVSLLERLPLTSVTAAIDWSVYDTWVRLRAPIRVSPSLVLVTRTTETDVRFGAGPLDHALLARMITAFNRAGASVIGLDIQLERLDSPGRSGAAGDAMLVEATRVAGRVVYPLPARFVAIDQAERTMPSLIHSSWPQLTPRQAPALRPIMPTSDALPALHQYASGVGHILSSTAGDNRQALLFTRMGDRAVPAFGLALAASFLQVAPENIAIRPNRIVFREARLADGRTGKITIPVHRDGQLIVNDVSKADVFPQSYPFIQMWDAIDHGDMGQLQEWIGGKIVLILADDAHAGTGQTPLERRFSWPLFHAQLLNTILTEQWVTTSPAILTGIMALLIAGLASWLLLSMRGWLAITGVILLGLGYIALAVVALWYGNVVAPLFTPLATLAVAAGGTSLWTHLTASHRIGLLETKMQKIQQELAVVREDLVRRESTVESLEEDLEAARAAVARSTGKEQEVARSAEALKIQLADATRQEESSRILLQTLEHELSGLRVASAQPAGMHEPEQEDLRQECERVGIVTRDPHVLNVFRDLKKAARSSLSILILGEAGTGKELCARAVHQLSTRTANPFVAVNMAAISPELFESELFGHVRGSFTGALLDRKGYFELAHQGTLFLDEIGDLRIDHQSKLLRVLQEQSFYRVGDTKPTSVNVRVVAATNKDLHRGVIEGWFREDLYFRLKGVVLHLPSLRERPHDVRLLAERFVQQAATQSGRHDVVLSQEALATLQAHRWKGNVRELQQCVQQAVALAEGPRITRADLRLTTDAAGPPRSAVNVSSHTNTAMDTSGDPAVLRALRQHDFDMQSTARALGWDRSTVTQRLKGMGFRALVETEGNLSKAAAALAGNGALTKTVELKLAEYHDHLIKTIQNFQSIDEAVIACKKRFKNLPDRHFKAVEVLITHYFNHKTDL